MRKSESLSSIDEAMYLNEDEEEGELGNNADENNACSSTSSSISGGTPRFGNESRPESLRQTSLWPQSYRRSIDTYSQFGSPGFTSMSPALSYMGASQLSIQPRQRKSSESLSSLSSSFLQNKGPNKDRSANEVRYEEPQEFFYHEISEYGHAFPRQCSTTQGILNGINVMCGVGILSTPYALKEGGWIGLIFFVMVAIISLYTGILLRHCLDSQDGLETYPDIGQAAFGTWGRVTISIFLYMELYAACVEFLILEGDNLSAVFPNVNLRLIGFDLTGQKLFIIMTAIFVLPTVWLRDLSLLSYVSALGVLSSVLVVLCVSWIGVVDEIGFHWSGRPLNFSSLPLSLGLYAFCYSGHSVFPNIYSSLKKPSQFPLVLLMSFLVCTILYGSMAVMGFMMFGEETQSQITLNLPQHFTASKVAIWCTIINPFTKYALSITPVALSMEELLVSQTYAFKSFGISCCLRTILVLSTVLVAILLPFFGYVMAFVGSLLSICLCMIFPASCFLKLMSLKATAIQKFLCILIVLVGFLFCITGTYSSIARMIQSY
ncbi:hypothetical protein KP509_15G061200 [Ceratopteris richardii]|uniref:Amino acid transporter transmembrane domain-containing protein n=1 Tax=Ceratopteris richardii TaxID=49495 RepID=A0A8T2T7P9_CERRI|nr:hypothetical protein KP509_15G061200 [Ceratopteris richardii]